MIWGVYVQVDFGVVVGYGEVWFVCEVGFVWYVVFVVDCDVVFCVEYVDVVEVFGCCCVVEQYLVVQWYWQFGDVGVVCVFDDCLQ